MVTTGDGRQSATICQPVPRGNLRKTYIVSNEAGELSHFQSFFCEILVQYSKICPAVLCVSYMSRSNWTALWALCALSKEHLWKLAPENLQLNQSSQWIQLEPAGTSTCTLPWCIKCHGSCSPLAPEAQVATAYSDLKVPCERSSHRCDGKTAWEIR